jgi:hypothetical protein
LVVPIFIDLNPGEVPGPLAVKVQGVHISERQEVDRALNKIAEVLGLAQDQTLTDEEWQTLTESVTTAFTSAAVSSGSAKIPAEFSRRMVPLNNGFQTGTLLAIEVQAHSELTDANVMMTSITGPPGAVTMGTPARLFWHPGSRESTTISQGALSFINVARVGPLPFSAVMDSPDHDLPWSLPNGAFRIGLQVTARGYSTQLITAEFNVRPTGNIPSQSIEWMELNIL